MPRTSSAETHTARDAESLHYTATGLDRAHHLRDDDAWLAQAECDSGSLVLPVWRDRNAVDGTIAEYASVDLLEQADERVFLGLEGERALFAADFSSLDADAADQLVKGRFEELRSVGPSLPGGDAAWLAYARGIMHWHRHHRFCGACGAPTRSRRAGHVRKCTAPECGRDHFPRTDPAVIMLIEHPETDGGGPRCLLGRTRRFPDGMYSVLAGFVEPGESLEQAVQREVYEESGIEIERPRYFVSQPWPFPGSVMIGFYARARTTAIRLDDDEIVDARWFTPEEVEVAASNEQVGQLHLPLRDSIARRLIVSWLGCVSE